MIRTLDLWLPPLSLAALLLAAWAAAAQSPAAPAGIGSSQPLAGAPADPPEAPLGPEAVQELIATLEDPARREKLIATLRALEAAQAEQDGADALLPDDVVASLLGEVTTRTETVRRVSLSVVDSLQQIPLLFQWLQSQAGDPLQRALWLDVALRLTVYFGIATLAYLAVAMTLRPVRRRLAQVTDGSPLDRLGRLCLILLLDLLPVLAFVATIVAVTMLATLAAVRPSAEARAVAQPLIRAMLLARASVALARFVFAPKAPSLRLLPLSDAAAAYGFRWTRRVSALAIYGWFALQAADALGLPWTLHAFLLHLLFLAVALLLIAIIIQCRTPVAEAIASLSEEPRSWVVRRLPWRALAGIWHLLAAFYVMLIYVVWALKIPGGFRLLASATLGSALIAIGCWFALRIIDQLFGRGRPRDQEPEAAPAGGAHRFQRYQPIIGGILRALVWLGAVVALLEVWGFGTVRWLASDAGQLVGGHLIMVVMIVVVTIAIWEVVSMVIERSMTEQDEEGNLRLSNRTRTLLNIVRNFLLVFLSLIGLFLILSELGLNIAPLLAGAGVIGLAIGFGSQKLVQDIITGMFVLLGDTIRIGDVVGVAARVGVVEEMTMRTVVLREYSGNVHTIPYSAIDTVTNYTKDFSYALFDVGVAYRENVDHVMEVLRQIGEEMNRDPYFRRLILEPLDVAGVDRFADSAVIIRARFKTRPLKQWEVGREFNRRLKNRFDELGIEIPFPHQTVYFGVDKQGRAPPVRVDLEGARFDRAEPPAEQGEPEVAQPAAAALARSRSG